MGALGSLLVNLLTFVLLMVPGFVLARLGKLSRSSIEDVGNILVCVAMPFLVFLKLLETDLRGIGTAEIVCCILLPAVLICILLLVSALISKKSAFRLCASFSNCGFLGIPLAVALFPDAPEIAVYVALFNLSSSFLLLTLGVFILSGDRGNIRPIKAIFSPVLFAVVLGVIFSLTGLGKYVSDYASMLAGLTTPLSMMVLGAFLQTMRSAKGISVRDCAAACGIKLILSPAFVMAVMLILGKTVWPELPHELAAAMLIASAVSTAATAPAMAEKYRADGDLAAALTLSTTAACVITLPLWWQIFEILF